MSIFGNARSVTLAIFWKVSYPEEKPFVEIAIRSV